MESVPWSLGVGDTAVRFVNKNIRTHSITAYTGAGSQAGSNRANFFLFWTETTLTYRPRVRKRALLTYLHPDRVD